MFSESMDRCARRTYGSGVTLTVKYSAKSSISWWAYSTGLRKRTLGFLTSSSVISQPCDPIFVLSQFIFECFLLLDGLVGGLGICEAGDGFDGKVERKREGKRRGRKFKILLMMANTRDTHLTRGNAF